ncbi:CoB--CoM heterodisulfide reductase iron-sulfur subunit B family protein [Desulfoferrobacter suflitae]|uniref:CoB--CoM heterodisulfide reductase iron-sulfur subunit B family protein n=1 Tax=Desulfoferrobacter suflitae TaxID=2865782 RepID=UPI00216445AE|nr:heterodisulfide reductase-related iron-sulfur binding cluster [Desulfoferrobacter suflitae]MCK8604255.1 heterodisulfide reductase-related iron-sulfur binding cluster [Desulfoferrobacter suflitae]
MIQMAYYPGCALQSMSWDYRESIKQVAAALGLQLVEVEEWTCCGATAAHSLDERMSVMLPARNIAGAEALGLDMAVACPMCFKRLALSRKMLQEKRVDDPWLLKLDRNIFDLARFLASEKMLEKIRDQVRRPLAALQVVCYYGCQVVRPPKITGYTDYENPRHLDLLAAAAGATAIDWSYKATCCGASMGIPKKTIGLTLVAKLLSAAHAAGAQAIVVCCPLCHSNLDLLQPELRAQNSWDWELPILYYTELLGIAFRLRSIDAGLASHLVDPRPFIEGWTVSSDE